jgi:Domain of unknown function (DUF4412)
MRWIGLVVMAVLMASVAQAQTKFEGVVNYQVTTKSGRPMVFDYYAKGSKARIEPHDSSGMVGAVIIDQDAKTQTIIMPTRRMYIVGPIDQNITPRMDSSMRNTKLVKAGSETIAGVPCDDYTVTNTSTQTSGTACIAHGMGDFAMASMGGFARMAQQVQGLSSAAAGGMFPLKWTGDGDSMIATNVTRKTVDASLFVPPAGYTQMQMPAGMQVPGGMQKP